MALPPVYTVQLISVLGGSGYQTYTPASNQVVIVRQVDCYNRGTGGVVFNMFFNGGPYIAYTALGTVAPNWLFQWKGRQAGKPGQEFVVASNAALDISVTGYLLTSP